MNTIWVIERWSTENGKWYPLFGESFGVRATKEESDAQLKQLKKNCPHSLNVLRVAKWERHERYSK